MNNLSVLKICVTTLGWDYVYSRFKTTLLQKKSNKKGTITIKKTNKISKNKISGIHASGVVLLSLLYKYFHNKYGNSKSKLIISVIEPFTVGYFVFDSVQHIRILQEKFNIASVGYIVHHILVSLSVMYCRQNKQYQNNVITILGLGEFSNLPSYIMYHLRQYNKKDTKLGRFVLTYQTIHYSFIRIFVILYYFLNSKTKKDILNISFWTVYMMGVYWSKLLWSQLLELKTQRIPSLKDLQKHPHTF